MNLDLSGRNALVGGSTQGIGRAVALELASLGANVTLLARNEQQLAIVAAELDTSRGQRHRYWVSDFAQPDQLRQTVAEQIANTQTIFHILINNTGGPAAGSISTATAELFLAAYQQHIVVNQYLAQLVLEGMKTAHYGRIINIISTSVKEPIEGLGVSNTTRAAVAAWAKTWAGEVAQYGITVNNVLPGFTNTLRLQSIIATKQAQSGQSEEAVINVMKSYIPARRFADPAEVAAAVAFLASPAAAYINGVNLPVDGGRTKSM